MSTKPEIFELMHLEIDGTASESQRAKLREALAASTELREEYDRLQGVTRLLAELKPVEPPARLTADVMRAVRARRDAASGGWVQRLRDLWPGGRVALPYAYAAAAGAAIAIFGLHALHGSRSLGPDVLERDAAATIGSTTGIAVSRTDILGSGFKGRASVRRVAGRLALDVDVPSAGPVEVSLHYDAAAVDFVGIVDGTTRIDRIRVDGGVVRWSQSGPQRVTVLLQPQSARRSSVQIAVQGGSEVAGAGALELPGTN